MGERFSDNLKIKSKDYLESLTYFILHNTGERFEWYKV